MNPIAPVERRTGAAGGFRVWLFTVVTLIAVALYLARLLLPSDLADNHQNSPVAYVLDVIHNGNWICQRDVNGAIASKPPLFVWMAVLAVKGFGRVNHFALALPSALATFGLAWIVLLVGRSHFGWRAGLIGATAYLLSTMVVKQMLLVRTDALFSFWVAVAALAAWRAWERGQGWTWFWLASAAATLTKGPLGLVLAAGGLLAACWERRSGGHSPIRGAHWPGVALFLLVTAGWLLLAYFNEGQAVFQKLFAQELYQRAISKGEGSLPLVGFYRPPLYFVSRFAPWSLATLVAAWNLCRSPAVNPGERRFERFLFCWLFSGMLLFSLAAHHRGDLLMPLLPAAALLAGREIGRATETWKSATVISTSIASAVLFLALFVVYTVTVRGKQDGVVRTEACRDLAGLVRARVGSDFPLIHVNTSVILQMHLGTFEQWVTPERALELLRGADPVFVVVDDPRLLSASPENRAPIFQVVAEIPRGSRPIRIVSNHPKLEWTDTMVYYSEPFLIRLTGVRGLRRRAHEYWATAAGEGASVNVINESAESHRLKFHLSTDGASVVEERFVEPDGQWQLQF